jgi:hypothetical protein
MRVHLLAVALLSAILIPYRSEASIISGDVVLLDNLAAGPAADAAAGSDGPSGQAWDAASLVPLFDEDGDPLLLLSAPSSFDQPDGSGKLRAGRPALGGVVFHPLGWGAGGSNGGGNGFPGPGTFIVLPIQSNGEPPVFLNQGPNFTEGLVFNPLTDCVEGCGGAGQTVPEPSMVLLASTGAALWARRLVVRRRAGGARN